MKSIAPTFISTPSQLLDHHFDSARVFQEEDFSSHPSTFNRKTIPRIKQTFFPQSLEGQIIALFPSLLTSTHCNNVQLNFCYSNTSHLIKIISHGHNSTSLRPLLLIELRDDASFQEIYTNRLFPMSVENKMIIQLQSKVDDVERMAEV